ncbi:PHD finger protein EHD3 isoform X1 [Sesamum indicum]|uniref:PHD finger protein EHD3 isoform X1 n=2 Tax=Sesamum indicum TaxID=4182 RepID=A0A6I9SYV3_SESIN|nr:PHD finger protein EHD3 isoform X1 [Sesamum indicum]XP_011074809.1 PHD finger protein EHD3 isoform X1 [Sesamum indicum]
MVMGPNVETMTANGVACNIEIGSLGLGGNGLVTYKRRRAVKVAEGGKTFDDSSSQPSEKSMKHSVDQAKCFQKDSDAMPVSFSDCSLKHQRNIILEQIYQSLDSEGGLVKCIQNALLFHPGSSSRTTVKESVHSCEDWNNCIFHAGTLHDDLHNATKDSVGTSCGSINESNHYTFTEICLCSFSGIIMSEKFAELCGLLLQNFQGIKADKLFDLNHINSRMKERAYENSPLQFQSDIQQIWMKLQKVGNDITALAKCLSDKTMASFCEQVGNSAHSISEYGKPEFLTQQSDMHPKPEPIEASALDEAHTCQHCKLKADGRNCLVCDSCEEMYHISCIEPAVKEIPTRGWYCAKCTAKGTESPHEYCTACERLNATRSPFDDNEEDDFMYGKRAAELEESSNELVANEGGKRSRRCTACRTEVRNDEEYRICGHSFCSHKFYHVKCLTSEQLISYGPCWYCPSCLCRACFTDRDDDKIVLCDGCDHAYHIYCMQPPHSAIPKGKWFCQECDIDIQSVRRARRTYENLQNISRKSDLDRKVKGEGSLNKSDGVDMLLHAAKTVSYEENRPTLGLTT